MSQCPAVENEVAAIRSPPAWALLGLVIERPSYGYELVQRFQRTYGETLVLSSASRIYRLLELLRSHSLIEQYRVDAQESALTRQPKPHFRATEQGVCAYQEWLVGHIAEERRRSWLFARQLAMLEPEAALEVIERFERENLEEAGEMAEARDEDPPAEGTRGVVERLAEEDERLGLGVRLSWTEYARSELKALIDDRAKEK